ncbi:ABC transporter substrate-binding protein [Saccharothrix violaceirubra]|uniref:Peptide/nickel transport system substrate-binding protein n=1 Tax=Saccharothrix violaceirubra TaxID=413306 RepID=A0A7W7WWK0_9PSEU|nr:ABC transporter substrate-binding protein [Saccharothrix violaceirubra]MBB4966077.1 peptide/nickel transport system substrate-binding protein [Saccharothrix violaceirubra]
MTAEPVRGGTIRILRDAGYDHLDPQRTATLQALALGQLLFRTLTAYGPDGQLVGDLATSTGRDVDGDGRRWEFVLRRGVRFEDGTEVTAADVAYGISRSFAAEITDGAAHLRNWLLENGSYAGPYVDGPDVPGLEVKDPWTLVFHFPRPRPELPFAVSTPVTAPVPRDRDTRASYDQAPIASGPYRIKSHEPGISLVLERNPHWDPETDPLRTGLPDGFVVEMGVDQESQHRRAIEGVGDDAYAVGENHAPRALAERYVGDPAYASQVHHDPTPLVWHLAINTQRVTDVDVRRAIAHALDRAAILEVKGGPVLGQVAHTLLSPVTAGYRDYPDPYPYDPARSAALVAGEFPTLRLISRSGREFVEFSSAVRDSLVAAGFTVDLDVVDRPRHNPIVRTRGNEYDLYLVCLPGEWPSASALLATFDGTRIVEAGNDNWAYLDDPGINAEIDRINTLPAAEAVPEWSAVDERLIRDHVPFVPLFTYVYVGFVGPKVRGVYTSPALGTPVYTQAHVG